MRDLDALLGSLVNIDRNSLIALLSSESEAAKRVAQSVAIERHFSAPSDRKRRSEPFVSTGFCRSYGTKKFRWRCLKVICATSLISSRGRNRVDEYEYPFADDLAAKDK